MTSDGPTARPIGGEHRSVFLTQREARWLLARLPDALRVLEAGAAGEVKL